MNWKFWTWGAEVQALREEKKTLSQALWSVCAERDALRNTQHEANAMLDKWQRPVGEQREAAAKLQEGLGALSETHPSWVAVMLFIEMERRFAHVACAAPFTSDREAWIAIGREQGIERVQMGLVKALIEAKKSKG